jgi:hypothetical protein
MKTTRIREKIKNFLGDRPRNTAEILEHINITMRHGTTSQQLANVLSKDKDIVKVGYIKRSGILSGGYDMHEWATRQWVEANVPEWVEGTPVVVDTEHEVDGMVAASASREELPASFDSDGADGLLRRKGGSLPHTKWLSDGDVLDAPDATQEHDQVAASASNSALARFELDLDKLDEEQDVNEFESLIDKHSDPKRRHLSQNETELLLRIHRQLNMKHQKKPIDLKITSESGILESQVSFSFSNFSEPFDGSILEQQLPNWFSIQESRDMHGWDSFPLSKDHLYDISPNIKFHDLAENTRKLSQAFLKFPLVLDHLSVGNFSNFLAVCRMTGTYRTWFSQNEFETSSELGLTISNTEQALVRTLDTIHFVLSSQQRIQPRAELSAMLFITSLERFVLTKESLHFDDLLDAFNEFTLVRGRNGFVDSIPRNTLHPCFDFDDPVFGTHLFMNLAVIEMAGQNPSVLEKKRMEQFRDSETKLLSRGLFVDRVPSKNGTYTSIHLEQKTSPKLTELVRHYRKIIYESSSVLSGQERGNLDRGPRIESESIDEYLSYAQHKGYDTKPSFPQVEPHQFYFRRYVQESFQKRTERTGRNRKAERSILTAYGDMSLPNPLRAFDSTDQHACPQNALEAIEKISHNEKNQGLRTQNRLVGLLDMLWGNLHLRESYGNRFVGLDLLEEIDSISSTKPEYQVAGLMLFHQHKVLRLYDKPGKDQMSRTNKLSRNNVYGRILHQFKLFLDDPFQAIDHLARPSSKSPLRRILHPIRLQTGLDLPFDELPYDAVLAIALSRMSTLIDAFDEVFKSYIKRRSETPTTGQSDSPSETAGAMLRSLATMLSLEVCQMHMMVRHLPCDKKSHMYYNQTKLAVEGNGFDAIRDDFSTDIRFVSDGHGFGIESIGDILREQGVPLPLELLQRLNHYCYSAWGAEDAPRKSLTRNEIKLVASMNLFVHNDEPTGMDYVQLVRDFDRLYVNHGPKFMSPGRFAFNSFEYF